MSDYKRLTKRAGWHKDIDLTEELGYSYIYQRLAEWENDYENGKVVRLDMKLPFKVGDTAYWLNGLPNCIQEYKVLGYRFDCYGGLRIDLGDLQPILFKCFGTKLFSSRRTAEQELSLKELQNGEN